MEHRKFTEKETKALEQIDGHLDECAKLLQEVEPDIFDTVPCPMMRLLIFRLSRVN